MFGLRRHRHAKIHRQPPVERDKFKSLEVLQNAPNDEFGVTHLNLIYSEEEDRCYCFQEAHPRRLSKNTIIKWVLPVIIFKR